MGSILSRNSVSVNISNVEAEGDIIGYAENVINYIPNPYQRPKPVIGFPSLPRHFVKRRIVAADISQKLETALIRPARESPHLLLLAGMPAIGKTTAALDAALAVGDESLTAAEGRVGKRVLWQDVGGQEIKVVLQRLARNLGLNKDATDWSDDELSDEVRRLCERWREKDKAILVLDNVEDDKIFSHVEYFDAVIATSRHSSCGNGSNFSVKPIDIPTELSKEERRNLLQSVMDKDLFGALEEKNLLSAVETLCDTLGNVALSLTIVSNILLKKKEQLLAEGEQYLTTVEHLMRSNMEYVSKKYQGSKYNISVYAAMLSYIKSLDENEKRCYLMLAVFPRGTQILPVTMKRLWDIQDAEEILEDFYSKSLITQREWDSSIKMYSFVLHDVQTETLQELALKPQELRKQKRTAVDIYSANVVGQEDSDAFFYKLYITLCLDVEDVDCAVSCLSNLRYLTARTRARHTDGCLIDFRNTIEKRGQQTKLKEYQQLMKQALPTAVAQRNHTVLIRFALTRPHQEKIFQEGLEITSDISDQLFFFPMYSPEVNKCLEFPCVWEFGIPAEIVSKTYAVTALSLDDDERRTIIGCTTGIIIIFDLVKQTVCGLSQLEREVIYVEFIESSATRCVILVASQLSVSIWTLDLKRSGHSSSPAKLLCSEEFDVSKDTSAFVRAAAYKKGHLWVLTNAIKVVCYEVSADFKVNRVKEFTVQSRKFNAICVRSCGRMAVVSGCLTVPEILSIEWESSRRLPITGEVVGFFLDDNHLLVRGSSGSVETYETLDGDFWKPYPTSNFTDPSKGLLQKIMECSGAEIKSLLLQLAFQVRVASEGDDIFNDPLLSFLTHVFESLGTLPEISSGGTMFGVPLVMFKMFVDKLLQVSRNRSSCASGSDIQEVPPPNIPEMYENFRSNLVNMLSIRRIITNRQMDIKLSLLVDFILQLSEHPESAYEQLISGFLKLMNYLHSPPSFIVVNYQSMSEIVNFPRKPNTHAYREVVSLQRNHFVVFDSTHRVCHIEDGREIEAEVRIANYHRTMNPFLPLITVRDKLFVRAPDNRIFVYLLETDPHSTVCRYPPKDALMDAVMTNEQLQSRSSSIAVQWMEELSDFVVLFKDDRPLSAKLLIHNKELFGSIDLEWNIWSLCAREAALAKSEGALVTRFSISPDQTHQRTELAFDPDDKIVALCYSSDKRDLVVALKDGSGVKLWRVAENSLQEMFRIGAEPTNLYVYDPRETVVCCTKKSSVDAQVTIWSRKGNDANAIMCLNDNCVRWTFSSNMKLLALATSSKHFAVWDLQTPKELWRTAGSAQSCLFSLSGTKLWWTHVSSSQTRLNIENVDLESGVVTHAEDLPLIAQHLVALPSENRCLVMDRFYMYEVDVEAKKQSVVVLWEWMTQNFHEGLESYASPTGDAIVMINDNLEVLLLVQPSVYSRKSATPDEQACVSELA